MLKGTIQTLIFIVKINSSNSQTCLLLAWPVPFLGCRTQHQSFAHSALGEECSEGPSPGGPRGWWTLHKVCPLSLPQGTVQSDTELHMDLDISHGSVQVHVLQAILFPKILQSEGAPPRGRQGALPLTLSTSFLCSASNC